MLRSIGFPSTVMSEESWVHLRAPRACILDTCLGHCGLLEIPFLWFSGTALASSSFGFVLCGLTSSAVSFQL
eukprot:12416415-Karenia_brevis.AAC.1